MSSSSPPGSATATEATHGNRAPTATGGAAWTLPRVLQLRAPESGFLWIARLGLLLGAFELYHAVSVAVPARSSPAHAHAAALIHLEQQLHILVEPRVQYAALHHPPLPVFGGILGGDAIRHATCVLYAGGQMPWLASMLLWLYLFRRTLFARVATLTAISTVLSILISAIYPVAPPRFALAGAPYRVEDVTGLPISEQDLARLVGFHPYTSLPSVHMLWALLTGLGLFLAARTHMGRGLALCFPASILATVVITGNHYLLDCMASATLLGLCLLAQRAWELARPRGAPRFGYNRAGMNRHPAPDLRSLNYPLALCACAGVVLTISGDPVQRLLGVLMIAGGAITVLVARGQVATGVPLLEGSPGADWWCGLLFIAGATTVGADDPMLRVLGPLLWVAAVSLPVVTGLRRGEIRSLAPTSRCRTGSPFTPFRLD